MAAALSSYSTADRLPPLWQGLNLFPVDWVNMDALICYRLPLMFSCCGERNRDLFHSVVCDPVTVLSVWRCGL